MIELLTDPACSQAGTEPPLEELFDELFPICRSITGPGFRRSMAIIGRYMPLEMDGVPSGSEVFDWTVPPEWHFRSAQLIGPNGEVILDSAQSNLCVVNYSAPIDCRLTLAELRPHLYSHPALPEATPYVTSYYKRRWGFCLPHRILENLPDGTYHARIDSEFVNGAVEYGQTTLPGESEAEILLSSYLCHPSLANNELSGPLALTALYHRIAQWPRRRFTYRFLLNPETIGSLCYLHRHGDRLRRNMAAGLVLTCLGGPYERLSYQVSRRGDSLLDRTAADMALETRSFDPTDGSDERQYCSPGFNLPVGQIARTVYGRYPEYHTSLDNKAFMNVETVRRSVNDIEEFLCRAELSGTFRNLCPYGEPQLGKRGLFPTLNSPVNKTKSSKHVKQIMTILNYSDGAHEMIAIAQKCGATVPELEPAITRLEATGLLAIDPAIPQQKGIAG